MTWKDILLVKYSFNYRSEPFGAYAGVVDQGEKRVAKWKICGESMGCG